MNPAISIPQGSSWSEARIEVSASLGFVFSGLNILPKMLVCITLPQATIRRKVQIHFLVNNSFRCRRLPGSTCFYLSDSKALTPAARLASLNSLPHTILTTKESSVGNRLP
jgi:hypothetical protein